MCPGHLPPPSSALAALSPPGAPIPRGVGVGGKRVTVAEGGGATFPRGLPLPHAAPSALPLPPSPYVHTSPPCVHHHRVVYLALWYAPAPGPPVRCAHPADGDPGSEAHTLPEPRHHHRPAHRSHHPRVQGGRKGRRGGGSKAGSHAPGRQHRIECFAMLGGRAVLLPPLPCWRRSCPLTPPPLPGSWPPVLTPRCSSSRPSPLGPQPDFHSGVRP